MGRLRPLPCEGGIIFSTTKQDGKLTALVTVGIMASKMHRTWGLKHMGWDCYILKNVTLL